MATLHWQRDIGDEINDAKDTFSSWDGCMNKAYCKWPTIVAIIIGSLIAISLLWCLFRCLCCGARCCGDCLSCCSSSRGKGNQGYQQAPPTPNPYYNQYQPPHQGPMYAGGGMGFRGASTPQTATFDSPAKNGAHYNADALPAMPSWDNATSRRVEVHDDVEMEKLDHDRVQSPTPAAGVHAAHENLLPKQETGRYYNPGHQESSHAGDVGSMSADPYHDYQQHRQVSSPSPYDPTRRPGAVSPYAPTYQSATSPSPYSGANNSYFGGGHHSDHYTGEQQRGYEPSIPPSYRTQAQSIVSPVSPQAPSPYPRDSQYQPYSGTVRQPAPGSWREV